MNPGATVDQARIVVVVFTIKGCDACAEYRPRFERVASTYAGCVSIVMADANDPRFTQLADRLGVEEVPVTFVLRKPRGVIRVVGSVPDSQINWLMGIAARESTCPTDW
jgi:thioredoxin-like negative regulator of GroEL